MKQECGSAFTLDLHVANEDEGSQARSVFQARLGHRHWRQQYSTGFVAVFEGDG